MTLVVLTPDVMVETGQAPTENTPLLTANTYKFRNNNKTLLHFKKTGANVCTVTIATNGAIRGHAVAAQTVSVPATTGDVFVGPFAHDVYDDINHDVSFTVSEVTGLTVEVLQIPS